MNDRTTQPYITAKAGLEGGWAPNREGWDPSVVGTTRQEGRGCGRNLGIGAWAVGVKEGSERLQRKDQKGENGRFTP